MQPDVEQGDVTQVDLDLEAWFVRRMEGACWKGRIAPMLAAHRLAAEAAAYERAARPIDAAITRMEAAPPVLLGWTVTQAKLRQAKEFAADIRKLALSPAPEPGKFNCAGCGGSPAPESNPCAVCGAALSPASGDGAGVSEAMIEAGATAFFEGVPRPESGWPGHVMQSIRDAYRAMEAARLAGQQGDVS
jgi:hypothetical protein